jgi:hypothetical protein
VTPFGAAGPKVTRCCWRTTFGVGFPVLALGVLLLARILPKSAVVRRRWFPALLAIALANDVAYR